MTSFDDQILRIRTIHTDEGALAVIAAGELDIATDEALRVAIADAAASRRDVILDLRGITFCGSSGIAVILDAQSALGERLRLLAGAEVRRVLELTGLTRLLDASGGVDPQEDSEPDREQAV